MTCNITWNIKLNKFEGFINGKIITRCAKVEKVVAALQNKGMTLSEIQMPSSAETLLSVARAPKAPKIAAASPIRDSLVAETHRVWELAKTTYATTMLPTNPPKVEFFNRGTTAGWANGGRHWVKFNEVLAAENKDTFSNTVIHEVAHIVTHHRYPCAKPHGREFMHVMAVLGGNPGRCHSYNVSSVKQKKTMTYVVYTCKCENGTKQHNITPRMHSKITSGYRWFVCKRCGERLVTQGKMVKVVK
jgi:SprT protein